jgi:hypothetical protein
MSEIDDHKKRIYTQLLFCLNKQMQQPDEDKWIDREIALHQAMALVDQTIVLEYGLLRIWEALQKNDASALPNLASRYSN